MLTLHATFFIIASMICIERMSNQDRGKVFVISLAAAIANFVVLSIGIIDAAIK